MGFIRLKFMRIWFIMDITMVHMKLSLSTNFEVSHVCQVAQCLSVLFRREWEWVSIPTPGLFFTIKFALSMQFWLQSSERSRCAIKFATARTWTCCLNHTGSTLHHKWAMTPGNMDSNRQTLFKGKYFGAAVWKTCTLFHPFRSISPIFLSCGSKKCKDFKSCQPFSNCGSNYW